MEFKEHLERLLAEHGETAYRLSKKTGISQGLISDYRSGRSKPKFENIEKIADFFGVPTDRLLKGKQESQPHVRLVKNEGSGDIVDYNQLTDLQKDLMQKAYGYYMKNTTYPDRVELSLIGVRLDLDGMHELDEHFRDLIAKNLIYSTVPNANVWHYWISDTGAVLMENNYQLPSQRKAEVKPLSMRKHDLPHAILDKSGVNLSDKQLSKLLAIAEIIGSEDNEEPT